MLESTLMGAERLFLKALFSWDEFQSTVRVGRVLLGDPSPLTVIQLRRWLREPAPTNLMPLWEYLLRRFPDYDHHAEPGFDFFIVVCCRTQVDVGQERKIVSTKLEAAYLLAHRSTEWLGIRSFNLTPYCWVYAFFGGNLNPYQPWPDPNERIKQGLAGKPDFGEFKTVVKEMPIARIRLNWTETEDLLDGLFSYPEFKSKYSEFGPWDISSHRYRQDKRTLEPSRDDSRKASAHPLYSLSHLVKFQGSVPWNADSSKAIDAKVQACLQGKTSVEEILCVEIMNNRYIVDKLEGTLQARGNAAFEERFRREADKVYRAVRGRFSRRGIKMPTPTKGWRKRCLNEMSDYFQQQKRTKEVSESLAKNLGDSKYALSE